MRITNSGALVVLLLAGGLPIAACGAGGASSPTAPSVRSPGATVTVAALDTGTFNKDFTTMAKLASVAAAGTGKIAVILPDTVSSDLYTDYDAPYLARAFAEAGLRASDTIIQNAQGNGPAQLSDARSDIASGTTVLILDPLDSAVGMSIEAYAKAHSVPVVDYDRIVPGGSGNYYVGFDNVKIGTLIGRGMASCIAAWRIAKPELAVMAGAPTDTNAALVTHGYNAVLRPYIAAGTYKVVANLAGTSDPATALTEFQQAYDAHPAMNAIVVPDDENAAPIISYLRSLDIQPRKFPVTGQDASLVGLEDIISGYQCGTVYKPIYIEAQAAATLALYLRAGRAPPAGLVNGSVEDTAEHVSVPSSLVTPEWTTPTNMESTVISDGFVSTSRLCGGAYAADCDTYGIH